MTRGDLTRAQWKQIEPLLPTNKDEVGGQWNDHRKVIHGIRWVLRTVAGWREMPRRYGPWQTGYDRFTRWQRDGTWDRILSAPQREQEREGKIDWEVKIDGSVVRAHQHAAGARKRPAKKGAQPQR